MSVEQNPDGLAGVLSTLVPQGTPAATVTEWVRAAKRAAQAAGLPPTADNLTDFLAKIIPGQPDRSDT